MITSPNNKLASNSYSFTTDSYFCFLVTLYSITKFMDAASLDKLVTSPSNEIRTTEFAVNHTDTEQLVTNTTVCYLLKNKTLVNVVYSDRNYSINFSSDHSLDELIKNIKHFVKTKNILRNKHVKVSETNQGFWATFEPTPSTSVGNVVIDKTLKDEIMENTVFHLKEMETSNGIILHGPPGTGKSLSCSLIINKAIEEGFSTCYLTSRVDYSELSEFLTEFMSPCIVILEDIDSFAIQRTGHGYSMISDFLQFLSGITQDKEQMIVIATTNYIEMLDEAISNRPARFNRKFKFEYPDKVAVDQLIDLYFGKNVINKSLKELCYDKRFCGAHIAEIKNTALRLSKKFKTPIHKHFERAVKQISAHFENTPVKTPVNAMVVQTH